MIVHANTKNPLGQRPMSLVASLNGLGIGAPPPRTDNRIAIVQNGDHWYAIYSVDDWGQPPSKAQIALLADPGRQKVIYDPAAVNALISGMSGTVAADISFSVQAYTPGGAVQPHVGMTQAQYEEFNPQEGWTPTGYWFGWYTNPDGTRGYGIAPPGATTDPGGKGTPERVPLPLDAPPTLIYYAQAPGAPLEPVPPANAAPWAQTPPAALVETQSGRGPEASWTDWFTDETEIAGRQVPNLALVGGGLALVLAFGFFGAGAVKRGRK